MGSSGGSGASDQRYYQEQQLALQREQQALQQRQHEESLALQREALDKPVAAIAKNVSLETQNMVENQTAERNKLRGIRSTYSLYAKDQGVGSSGSGADKLGE